MISFNEVPKLYLFLQINLIIRLFLVTKPEAVALTLILIACAPPLCPHYKQVIATGLIVAKWLYYPFHSLHNI